MREPKLKSIASDLFDKATLPARQSTAVVRSGKKMERYVNGQLAIERACRSRRNVERWTIRILWNDDLVFSGEGRRLAHRNGVPFFDPHVTTFVRGAWEKRLRSLYDQGVTVPRRHGPSRWRPHLP